MEYVLEEGLVDGKVFQLVTWEHNEQGFYAVKFDGEHRRFDTKEDADAHIAGLKAGQPTAEAEPEVEEESESPDETPEAEGELAPETEEVPA